jgi:hypothetical protein
MPIRRCNVANIYDRFMKVYPQVDALLERVCAHPRLGPDAANDAWSRVAPHLWDLVFGDGGARIPRTIMLAYEPYCDEAHALARELETLLRDVEDNDSGIEDKED